jgi:enterochelin esterase-like enzyme
MRMPHQVGWRSLSCTAEPDNRVTVYLPAGFDTSARYPLLIMHDGGDYLGYASMKIILDSLIDAGMLSKIMVAFTYPGERLTEYPDDPDHVRWITDELLRHLEGGFPLLDASAGRCLMGSFGAVAALSTRSGSLACTGRCCCSRDHSLIPSRCVAWRRVRVRPRRALH